MQVFSSVSSPQLQVSVPRFGRKPNDEEMSLIERVARTEFPEANPEAGFSVTLKPVKVMGKEVPLSEKLVMPDAVRILNNLRGRENKEFDIFVLMKDRNNPFDRVERINSLGARFDREDASSEEVVEELSKNKVLAKVLKTAKISKSLPDGFFVGGKLTGLRATQVPGTNDVIAKVHVEPIAKRK